MANRRDGYHPSNDKVEDVVLTKVVFQKFYEESKKELHELQQVVATLLIRKSFPSNTNQSICRRIPKYEKVPFFDGEM